MTTQLNIFISSKMVELAAERRLLQELIPTLDTDLVRLRAWVFEADAPASNASIREVYLNALKHSALYLGLFWNQYGEWTIDEFERASEWGIDRHIYVKNVNAEQRDPKLQKFLEQQSDVISGITPKWFRTPEELCEQVSRSIQVWLQDRLLRRPGDTSATFAELADDIPELPARLIGRDGLLAEARALLEDNARVLLQGFGGMGKTALAATLAADWLDADRGAVVWLRAGTESADTLFEALAAPFDYQQAIAVASGTEKIKAVRTMLANSGATLLVLDDVWDGAALSHVLKAVPRGMAVLVTARQRYALDDILEVGRLDPDEALRLLGHFARQDYAGDPDAYELCRQVGYHAFALEVAGKTIKVDRITPASLLQRIAAAPHDIAMPEHFAEEGRSSIKELLDASLNALDAEARRTFLAFGGLFIPSATADLLARCMGADEARIREALFTLQRRGLAERIKSAEKEASAFRIHDLAFSYARTITMNQGHDRQGIIAACRDYVLSHEADLEALDIEQGNIFGAAQAARDSGDKADLVRIMEVLIGRYLSARGHNLPFLELLDAAILATEQMGADYDETRHYLLSKRGNAYYDRANLASALTCYQQALELARKLALADREVILLSVMGRLRSDQGEADSETCLQQAYQLAVALEDDFLIGFALESQGYHAQARGDYEATRRIASEQMTLARRIDDRETLFYALVNLGFAEQKLGQFAIALDYHQQALKLAQEADNRMWLAIALQSIGEDQHQLGAHSEAQLAFREALALFREGGMKAKSEEIEAYMRQANYPPA